MEKQLTVDIEEPLQGFIIKYPVKQRQILCEGPKKAIRLFILCIALPGLIISTPIYLKHRVFDHHVFPLGTSDMRLVDNRVSTTWCQRQIIRANTTFNAFLLPDNPEISKDHETVTMTRRLILTDDMKEYWGFYLIKGSKVRVSTCARWPGASLILIRGHKHLHECAYIGDDSSEEQDELDELNQRNTVITPDMTTENPSNRPDKLKKLSHDVEFADPVVHEQNQQYVFIDSRSSSEPDDMNAKKMREVLHRISMKKESQGAKAKYSNKKINDQENNKEIYIKKKSAESIEQVNNHRHRNMEVPLREKENVELSSSTTTENPTTINSSEMFDDILLELHKMGDKGEKIIKMLKAKLNKELSLEETAEQIDKTVTEVPLMDNSSKELVKRIKRHFELNAMRITLNEDDEARNKAIEEGFSPDGHADHHFILNETTLNDLSNSEYWSSFSSSEEALLNCAGLILSLPLSPNGYCTANSTYTHIQQASLPNTLSYTVPKNGYYFFVFNSENEVQENFINVQFHIDKVKYDVSSAVAKCDMVNDVCSLPLSFFSKQKVVFEFPITSNDSMWNHEFIVVSECEPRTLIYLICVLSVPLLILLFAFQ